MIEEEIKLELKNEEVSLLIDNLKSLGSTKEFCVKQVTYRFDTKNKDLEKKGVFLRTRTGEKSTFTVKKKVKSIKKNVKSREEMEVDLDEEKKILMINKMLENLGYNYCKIMEKYRMQWELDNCKIAIDELLIGFYVEVEGKKDKIFQVIEKLKLESKKPIIKTYWDLFEDFKKRKGIKNKEDIKFKNSYNSKLFSFD